MSVRPGFEHGAESLLADHGALIWWSPPVLYLKYCHRLCFSFDPHFQQLCVHHTLSYTDARRRIFLWTWQWAPKNSAPWTSLIPLNKQAIFTTAWFWLNIVIVILDLNKKANWSRNQTWSFDSGSCSQMTEMISLWKWPFDRVRILGSITAKKCKRLVNSCCRRGCLKPGQTVFSGFTSRESAHTMSQHPTRGCDHVSLAA